MNDLFTPAGAGNIQSGTRIFSFNGIPVRAVKDESGNPWFVAKDVCDVLEIKNSRDTLNKCLDEDERGVDIIYTPGGNQEMTIVSEAGLYSLILRSRKPEAKAFKRWVTHEVLPSIRATGGYIGATPGDDEASIMARALEIAHATLERNKARLEEANREIKQLAPDAEYARDVLASQNLHTVNSIAVHLGISAIKLNRFLVDRGFIYKQGDIYCPSCKIRDKGYCDFHVVPYINSNGDKMTREHLKWTEAGRKFVIEEYNKSSKNIGA